MSIKGLSIITLGAAALCLAAFASTSSAVVVLNPITLTGSTPTAHSAGPAEIGPKRLPSRPPGRSLYRPGPRNPVTSLE